MTIKLPNPKDQRAVQDALKNPEGSAFFFSLAIDDLELGDYIYGGEWGSQNSGGQSLGGTTSLGPISATLHLGTRLSRIDQDAPSAFVCSVNGIDVAQMVGLTSRLDDTQGRAGTDFISTSALAQAARIDLDDVTQYPGWTPDKVVRDCFSRLPHSRGASYVEPLSSPILNFQAPDTHFWPEEKVADVLRRVQDQTPYVIRDNAWGGSVAQIAREPASQYIEDYRVYSYNDFPNWRTPLPPDARYSEVVVYRRGEDGRDVFKPPRERVYYPRQKHIPPARAALRVSLDDTSEQAPQRARNLAAQLALRVGRGAFQDDSIVLPFFDPLIELQDVMFVYEDAEDIRGMWSRMWLMWIESYSHDFRALTTTVSYSAALIEEDEIKAPILAMPGVSGGVVETTLAACDRTGDILRFDSERLDWVIQLGDVIYFADGAGNVFQDGDVIRIICPYGPTYEAWGEYPEGTVYFLDEVSWESSDGLVSTIDEAVSGGYASSDGLVGTLITGVQIPTPTILWGERPPFVGFFDDSVSWNSSDGITGTVDESASGGHAVVSGDGLYVTIS